jgi:hypothetical protein
LINKKELVSKSLKRRVTIRDNEGSGTITGTGVSLKYKREYRTAINSEENTTKILEKLKSLIAMEKIGGGKSEIKDQIVEGLKKEVLEATGMKETFEKGEKVIESVKDYRLKAKSVYESAGYFYKTDAKGRIAEVKGKLRIDKAERSAYHQKYAGGDDRIRKKYDEQKEIDDGGHLIAARFGGSKKIDNLVAMDSKINRHEDYRDLEDIWEKEMLKTPPNEVFTKITPIYKGYSKRPVAFNIEYEVYDSQDKLFKSEKIFIKNS